MVPGTTTSALGGHGPSLGSDAPGRPVVLSLDDGPEVTGRPGPHPTVDRSEDGVDGAEGRGALGYVASLDGLRAIAVVAVVAYHAGPADGVAWLRDHAQGGFLGVSAFFTLSGFLITSLLLDERDRTGHVSLGGFLSRRLRRLMPASLATLALVAVLTPWVGTPGQLRHLPAELWAALGYVANWRFVLAGNDYAELFAGAPSPLRHFWSLAVEEQWYLVTAPLVGACLAVARGRRWLLGAVLGALAAGSVALTVVLGDGAYSNRVYLGTDTRLAEIAIGGLAAVLLRHHRQVSSRAIQAVLGLVGPVLLGLGLGVWSTTDLRDPWLYRGGLAAHAVAVSLVVWAALQRDSPLRAVLSLRPLVWLGRISYGVYLFHWPVLWWLSPDRLHLGPWAALGVQTAVVLALATASHHLLELPIRTRRWVRSWRRWALPVAGVAGVALLGAALPQPDRSRVSALEEVRDLVVPTAAAPRATTPGAPPTTALRPPVRTMVVGDSFALSLVPGLQDWALDTGRAAVLNRAIVGCGVARGGENRGIGLERPWPEECRQRDATLRTALQGFDPEVVVVAGGMWDVTDRRLEGDQRWRTIGDPVYDAYLASEIEALSDLLASSGAVVVWTTAPHWNPEYFRNMYMGRPPYAEAVPERTDRYNALLRTTLATRPDLHLVDLGGWMTANLPGGEFGPGVRMDGVHLTAETSDIVADWLGPQLLTVAPG